MTLFSYPTRVAKGQLLWLELHEFENRPKVAVRVFAVKGPRAQVEILASDHSIVSVEKNRLWEEVAP